MIVSIKNLQKSYGSHLIFDHVNLDIHENDRIGIVGENGIGKTTFLNVVTKKDFCDQGEIVLKHNLKIGYLQQNHHLNDAYTLFDELKSVKKEIFEMRLRLSTLQAQMKNITLSQAKMDELLKQYEKINHQYELLDGYTIEYQMNYVLNGLGFQGFDLNRKVSSLSGGEKIRFSLVKILLQTPDLLILDEPTNHLDFHMIEWLENYLENFKGAILLVSHDRYFLDKICTSICELENTVIERYKGNYSSFLIQKQEKVERLNKEYEKQQERIEKLTEFVQKNLAKSASVNGVGTRVKELENMEKLERVVTKPAIQLNFKFDKPSYKEVLKVKNMSILKNQDQKEDKIYLLHKINLDVLKGEKIAIIGSNGIGKTTFLKALLNQIPYEGSIKWGENVIISYFDQQLESLNLENRVMDEIHNKFPYKTDLELRKLYAKLLITDDMVFQKIKELSGANRVKVKLAIMMLEKANVLLLDEPSNHLDYMAKEELNRALKEYQGTIIMVSHDRYLLNNVANKIVEITPSGMNLYQGNFDYYQSHKKIFQELKVKNTTVSKEKNQLLQILKKKLNSVERKIEKLEIEITQQKEKLNNVEIASNYLELSKIDNIVKERESKLIILMEEWTKITEELEKMC